jgi:LysM repeat protein
MKIFEVTGPEVGGNVQYQPVADKGPKTPEQLAAINAQRAASGEQAAVVADTQARMATGLYAQPPGAPAATTPAAPAPAPAVAPTPATPAAPTLPKQPAASTGGQYVVKAGDTLTKIAKQMGTQLPELLKANPQYQANPNLIRPGEKINPPGTTPEPKVGMPVAATPASTTATPAATTTKPARDNFAQANAYLDQQEDAIKQKWADNRARAYAARQKSGNANAVVDQELAAMDKGTAAINATAAKPVSNQFYIQPAKIGMNGEMDYVVVDKNKGLEVKSFNSPAEATAWIKQQPLSEDLSRILTIAGLK